MNVLFVEGEACLHLKMAQNNARANARVRETLIVCPSHLLEVLPSFPLSNPPQSHAVSAAAPRSPIEFYNSSHNLARSEQAEGRDPPAQQPAPKEEAPPPNFPPPPPNRFPVRASAGPP